MSEVIQPLLQVLQPRDSGWKYSRNTLIIYVSGQSNAPEYRVRFANHYNYPLEDANPTGRITFSVGTAYWQGDKIQAKEVYNSDPLSTGMDTTLDVGWSNLHGFTFESIGCGGSRHVRVRINGTGLTFEDVLLEVTMTLMSPA